MAARQGRNMTFTKKEMSMRKSELCVVALVPET